MSPQVIRLHPPSVQDVAVQRFGKAVGTLMRAYKVRAMGDRDTVVRDRSLLRPAGEGSDAAVSGRPALHRRRTYQLPVCAEGGERPSNIQESDIM
jgi:hypothetical protein